MWIWCEWYDMENTSEYIVDVYIYIYKVSAPKVFVYLRWTALTLVGVFVVIPTGLQSSLCLTAAAIKFATGAGIWIGGTGPGPYNCPGDWSVVCWLGFFIEPPVATTSVDFTLAFFYQQFSIRIFSERPRCHWIGRRRFMKTIAAVLVFFLLLGKDDDAKAQTAEEKSFGKALFVGSPNRKTGARGATIGQSEEGNLFAPFERSALHPSNRHTDSKHYAVASTEPAVEMRVLPESDQSISRFLPYMRTTLVESGGPNVSRRTYIAKKIAEIAEKEEINMDRMGRRTRPTRVELEQSDAQKPQSRIQERKRIQRTERGTHQRWEGQQRRRGEEWSHNGIRPPCRVCQQRYRRRQRHRVQRLSNWSSWWQRWGNRRRSCRRNSKIWSRQRRWTMPRTRPKRFIQQ